MPEATRTRRSTPLWLVLLLLAAAIGNGVAVLWQARVLRRQAAQIGERTRENLDLRRRLDQPAREQAGQPPARVTLPAPRFTPSSAPAAGVDAVAAAEPPAQGLHEALALSNAEVMRLQAHVSALQSQIETATEENRRLTSAAEDGKKTLDDANQTIESIRAELKSNSVRMAQLEAANAKLKEDAASGKQSAAQLSQAAADLEGIFRRRGMYLNNILRRYREITEQYRAMSGVLDSRLDRERAPVSSTEISRIQNAIALAEEDLKQINALNAQAARLEKKLPAK